jgi:hypothetical protein
MLIFKAQWLRCMYSTNGFNIRNCRIISTQCSYVFRIDSHNKIAISFLNSSDRLLCVMTLSAFCEIDSEFLNIASVSFSLRRVLVMSIYLFVTCDCRRTLPVADTMSVLSDLG